MSRSIITTGRRSPSIGRGDRYCGAAWATRSPVLARNGMVATELPLASEAAIDILRSGGSAVDAAIAANACLGLMAPVMNGIGGDLFAMIWDPKTARLHGYNGSGRSPKGRDLATLRSQVEAAWVKAGIPKQAHIPPFGSLSVTVPGTVDGWFALHERFGKLPMADILAPAIRHAGHGFPVTQLIAFQWKSQMAGLESNIGLIEELDNARGTYLIQGRAPEEGEIFRNPGLAHTYGLIARKGRDAFYTGKIARGLDAYFRRIGGDLRYEDFAAHRGEWVTPLSGWSQWVGATM